MEKILFVCLGNICRSPMGEFIMKDLVRKEGLEESFLIASAATSSWETGSTPHPGASAELSAHGISCAGKRSVQLRGTDYSKYDLFLGMDSGNIRDMNRLFGGDPQGKIHKLTEYTDGRDIDDPYYSGDFAAAYKDIHAACKALLEHLMDRTA